MQIELPANRAPDQAARAEGPSGWLLRISPGTSKSGSGRTKRESGLVAQVVRARH
jgi:hypothetical protein